MITTVLLVDDDPDEHEIFSLALKKYNNKMTCVSLNGRIDDLFLINFVPDVIFLDMNLPGEDGIACLRKIKEAPMFADIPVYMFSTASNCYREREALKLGALRWITKPKNMIGYAKMFEELFPSDNLPLSVHC